MTQHGKSFVSRPSRVPMLASELEWFFLVSWAQTTKKNLETLLQKDGGAGGPKREPEKGEEWELEAQKPPESNPQPQLEPESAASTNEGLEQIAQGQDEEFTLSDAINELRAVLLIVTAGTLEIFDALINAYPGLRPDLMPRMSKLSDEWQKWADKWFPEEERSQGAEEGSEG